MDNTKTGQKYVVYSNGFILNDFDRAEVIAKLSKTFRKPEERMATRLLNGKASKIKSFEDQEKAEKLVLRLTTLGLNCYMLSPSSDDLVANPVDQKNGDEQSIAVSEFSQSEHDEIPESLENYTQIDNIDEQLSEIDTLLASTAKQSNWKKWLLSLVFLVVALACAAVYFGSKWLAGELPKSVSITETALFASQKPSALLHADLTQIRRALSLADNESLNQQSSQALSSLPLLNVNDDAMTLLAATNYVSSSATFSNEQGTEANWLTVLQGDYSQLSIEQELAKVYTVENAQSNLLALVAKSKAKATEDGFECPADPEQLGSTPEQQTIYAHISASEIVLASVPEHIASFNEAFQNSSQQSSEKTESPILLKKWQNYRGDSMFAMSAFDKQLLSGNFMARAASTALFDDTRYESMGIRASLNPIKQAITFNFDADMNDSAIAKQLSTRVRDSIAELSEANAESFPSVIALLSRIGVSSDKALHLSLDIDQELGGEIGNLVSDFFNMMFSMSPSSQENSDTPEEVLERYTWDYSLNEKMLIDAPAPIDQFSKFKPLVVNKGVAIFINSLGVKPISTFEPEQGEALQITLQAKRAAPFGDAFFAWSNSGITQSLIINEVLDDQGNELLIDERCTKPRFSQSLNHQANDTTNYSNEVIDTSKTVRLIESASVDKIAKLKGKYTLSVPSGVTLVGLGGDKRATEWQGGAFKLSEISKGRVSYILTDSENRLLDVRGLNKEGKALSSSSSFSGGKRYTKEFKGEVASIELVLAGAFEEQSFEFEVDTLIPQAMPDKQNGSIDKKDVIGDPILFNTNDNGIFTTPLDLSTLNEQETKDLTRRLNWTGFSLDSSNEYELGNLTKKSSTLFFKHDSESSWNKKLEGIALIPHLEALQFADGLVRIILKLDQDEARNAKVSISKSSVNGKPVASISTGTLNHDIANFSISFEEQREKIKQIEGSLEYTLPTEVTVQTIDLLEDDLDSLGLTFKAYSFSFQAGISYQLSEQLAAAYFIKLTTANGSESAGTIETTEGVSTVTFEQISNLQKIDFYFIKESETISQDFTFTPTYP